MYGWWVGELTVSGEEDFRFGFYTTDHSRQIDQIVYSSQFMLPVWGAGNDLGDEACDEHFEVHPTHGFVFTNSNRPPDGGTWGYDTLHPRAVAKNVLTVGSVRDLPGGWSAQSNPQPAFYTAYGRTDDGRIKPDVCANGEEVYSAAYDDPDDPNDGPYATISGTSMATASVTGTLGLLVELLRRHRGDAYQPAASLLKGLVIHTADDILEAGPDYRSGWGLVNARTAAELIAANDTLNHEQNVRMVLLQNGVTLSIPVTATGGVPLRVTVCTTEPAGTPQPVALDPDDRMLVNDFSLRVTTAGAGPFLPFVLDPDNPADPAEPGVNDRDNAEQVLISSPVADQVYTILLEAAPGETFVDDLGQPAPQLAALLVSNIQPDPALDFCVVSIAQTDADKFCIVWAALVGSVYRVQESFDLTEESWSDLTGDIVAEAPLVASEITSDPAIVRRAIWRVVKIL